MTMTGHVTEVMRARCKYLSCDPVIQSLTHRNPSSATRVRSTGQDDWEVGNTPHRSDEGGCRPTGCKMGYLWG